MLAALAFGAVLSHNAMIRASDGPASAARTDRVVDTLIVELGDPSFKTRELATQRLCAIGNAAVARLREAAGGDEAETALRAQAIVAVLEQVMFAGVEVRLGFSKSNIAWNEPVDLIITMTNRSAFQARVPFEIQRTRTTDEILDARQVADMLDVAEWARVTRPGGGLIELLVDDIADDPAVVAAVNERLSGGPTTVLEPGEQVRLTIATFNRGWARYPLLDTGAYTLVMDYVPQWNDETLATERVGRMISNEAVVSVTSAAPDKVSRTGGQKASLGVRREGVFFVAELTNRADLSMLVNTNFGPSAPFAVGYWVFERDTTRHEVSVAGRQASSWQDFDDRRLVPVAPGRNIELARISADDLRRSLENVGAKLDDAPWTIHFSYSNLCSRQWQLRQGSALIGNPDAPKILQAPVPRKILAARHTSNRLRSLGPG